MGRDYLTEIIRQALETAAEPGTALGAYGGAHNFAQVLDAIDRIERANSPVAGETFLIKDELFSARPGAKPEHAAAGFSRLMDKWDNHTRPSIPGIALGWLDQLGVSDSQDAYQQQLNSAVLLTAARAEMVRGEIAPDAGKLPAEPDYHSRLHFLHVLQAAGHILETNDGMRAAGNAGAEMLGPRDKTLVLLAAIAHDLDHPGRGNPKDPLSQKPVLYANEEMSFGIADGIFRACGLTGQDRQTILTLLRTTDPAGPHKFLKDAMNAHLEGRAPLTLSDVVPGEETRYSDLEPLLTDRKLCAMAAMLSDADLFGSAGAGMHAQHTNSAKLTREMKSCGVNMDFTTAAARNFFFTSIVGENGFTSAAGRQAFNGIFNYMLEKTRGELESQSRGSAPAPKAPH